MFMPLQGKQKSNRCVLKIIGILIGGTPIEVSEAAVECRSFGDRRIFLVDGRGSESQGCGWDPVRTGGDGNPA
jgi:hypothetical protein